MTLIHIVLVKVKTDLSSSALSSFRDECQKLKEDEGLAPLLEAYRWGPPEYEGRNKGYNWGLYSTFSDKSAYEKYRDHAAHKSFVEDILKPHVDEILAYDIQV